MIELHIINTSIPPNMLGKDPEIDDPEDIVLWEAELFRRIKEVYPGFNYPYLGLADYNTILQAKPHLADLAGTDTKDWIHFEIVYSRMPKRFLMSDISDEMDETMPFYKQLETLATEGVDFFAWKKDEPWIQEDHARPPVRNIVEFSQVEMVPETMKALEAIGYLISRHSVE